MKTIRNNKKLLMCLNELKGHDLVCFCKPKLCHGDILVKLLEERIPMINGYITCIGSRDIPIEIGNRCNILASQLEQMCYCIRSGGAVGADTYFENGISSELYKEIFVVNRDTNHPNYFVLDELVNNHIAYDMVKLFHPVANKLPDFVFKLMARNSYQLLGLPLTDPKFYSKLVLCYTPNAKMVGGTSQTLRIANHYNIPIINLGDNNINNLSITEILIKIKEILLK